MSARAGTVRMYEYLLTIDGNESRARTQAETVVNHPTNATDIHATLLHVTTESDPTPIEEMPAITIAQDILADAGIGTDLMRIDGDPTTVILETAEEIDAERICIAGRKRSPTGKAVFGSVTQGIILSTTRPVLVCHTEEQ
ncbi:universal stress protein [Halocatena pleomorpha]|uniref:Universal stress protein n=1 Tax=Halocatena pleomorpha TaxID=1785090 RepID=A0A3P3RC25_9EURY|nr:universal stress protein [Halocatena pleomorpha]RRJ31032.1 universal stress protein [Halocatena pleomorpha]